MLVPKADWELEAFLEFALAVGLDVDVGSSTSEIPPRPDVRFTVQGEERFAELVEITDEELAQRTMRSLKDHKITGGAFSQRRPLFSAFEAKSKKTYDTNGSPLILLAYYDKQFAADNGTCPSSC